MGLFYLQDADEAPPVETWDQSNGLACPASVGAVILTGEAYGRVNVMLDIRDAAPTWPTWAPTGRTSSRSA